MAGADMFSNKVENSYTIGLPVSTSQEIIEWFEIMAVSNRLSEELIHLVYNHIKNEPTMQISFQTDECKDAYDSIAQPVTDQDDFLSSLYNWQDANNQIFLESEPKVEKKAKKKMLCV